MPPAKSPVRPAPASPSPLDLIRLRLPRELANGFRPHTEAVTGRLGWEKGAEEFTIGFAMSVDEAVAYALADETADVKAAPPQPSESPLTKREQQIAELVAKGMTNREIAQTLVISQRTAETHVEHILTKLGFTNRAQIADWIVDSRR